MINIECDRCGKKIEEGEGMGEFSVYMLPKVSEGKIRNFKSKDLTSFSKKVELCEACALEFSPLIEKEIDLFINQPLPKNEDKIREEAQ